MTAPTRLSGYVDDTAWSLFLGDVLETVPDLTWPLSVQTYAQMRRDPQLTAVLKGYTLPIRRASWGLNGAGCRPEVAAMVADDMGLPLNGVDTPGAARVRGVSWRDHLRTALLDLTYGHIGFEMLADVSTGKARLIELSERMPHTIQRIHVDKVGRLTGITQDTVAAARSDVPQIRAEHLVWYAHEREGATWQGTSLLRPAFAPWLLKREMQRVHATSNRRFGMGVPTVRALPGTNPTPEQQAAAAGLAQAVRVGDQGGASIPPNYIMELIGLSGSVPDTLAFMKWLDQQMSRMALAGFLDLGDTSNGSRALGESFVDLFVMSLQSIAEDIADTATRQIAARIVEWNWGPDEPVPAVTVSDIGSRREVTAEALQLLLTSGALAADPELEAWVRREFRLPERAQADGPAGKSFAYDLDYGILTIDERRAQIGLGPLPNGEGAKLPTSSADRALAAGIDPEPTVTAAAKRLDRRRPGNGQLALPVAAATPATTGVDPAAIQADYEEAVAELTAQLPELSTATTTAIVAAVLVALAGGSVAALGTLAVPPVATAVIADALTASMIAIAAKAADQAVDEAAAQGITITAGVADEDRLAEQAEAITQVLVSGLANGGSRVALLNAGDGIDPDVVAGAVETHLEELVTTEAGWAATSLASALSIAQAAGRVATFTAADVTGAQWIAAEDNDGATCKPCSDIDGTVFASLEDAIAAYPTGRYVDCLGRDRCRGFFWAKWPTPDEE